jgi:hypothetical protein
LLVIVKLVETAGFEPVTVAVTEYPTPGVPLAVGATEVVAIPLVPVVAVVVASVGNPALAPVPGAENVIGALGTTFPPASFANTLNGSVNWVPMPALWLFPPFTVSVAAGPARLVRTKLVESSGVVPGMDAVAVSAPARLLAV